MRIIALKALGELGLPQNGEILQLFIRIIESDRDSYVRYKAAHLLASPVRRMLPEQATPKLWEMIKYAFGRFKTSSV